MIEIEDNDELKSYIVDGVAKFDGSIICDFDIDVEANIIACDIHAKNIDANDITANVIRANDVNAYDVCVNAITANNIEVNNMDADTIDANDIKYYAFCIAYSSFNCASVVGSRGNSIHKCLDEPIEIVKRVHQVTVQGNKFNLTKEELETLKKQLKW